MKVPAERNWRKRKEIYSYGCTNIKKLRRAFAYGYWARLKRKNQTVFNLEFERLVRRKKA